MASSLIACLLLELAVTVILGTQVRFPRHVVEAPWGIRYNEPHSSYWHTSPDVSVQFRINAQGMRADEDFAYSKPAGTKRIICLGDSFTAGYEVDSAECFASLIGEKLRAAGHSVEVLNAGVSGFSNAEELVYLERELLKYSPDAVLVSFFINDLDDNIRSDLFKVTDGELVEANRNYVPLGGIGNFVNRNWLCSFLSEHSNAFALLKEGITRILKRKIIEQNSQNVTSGKVAAEDYQAVLTMKIFDRIYDICHERGIPLVIQSIPFPVDGEELVDLFPGDGFSLDRPGLYFVPAREFLAPHLGKTLLYYEHSHWHWTPFAHELSASRLADLLAGLL